MSTNVRFYLSHDIMITKHLIFWRETVNILPYFAQRHNGRHYIMRLINKPLVVYRFDCMALYHSQTRGHAMNNNTHMSRDM